MDAINLFHNFGGDIIAGTFGLFFFLDYLRIRIKEHDKDARDIIASLDRTKDALVDTLTSTSKQQDQLILHLLAALKHAHSQLGVEASLEDDNDFSRSIN